MKYIAISKNIDGVLINYIYNTINKSFHSSWDTLEQAQKVATDLNKQYDKQCNKAKQEAKL